MPVLSAVEAADVAIIDYGMGNLLSVSQAFEHVAPEKKIVVTSDPAVISAAVGAGGLYITSVMRR